MAAATMLTASIAHAEWRRDETTLAWRSGDQTIWRFSFDPTKGKPFFDPVAVAGGPSLSEFRPADHPHHYALWFAWKYINGSNYWEETATSGKTRWSDPAIETRPDGSATIKLDVTYVSLAGKLDLSEQRELRVSAPQVDGRYTIDWRARFTAGAEGALLDRTAMPGEPKGQVNGGYAGLSIRLAGAPLVTDFLSTAGPITEFVNGRSRPSAPAVAASLSHEGRNVGAVAFFSDPKNAGEAAPWYLINQGVMRFMCAAILAPKPRQIPAGGQWSLNYRVAFRPGAWTSATLESAYGEWLKSGL